MTGNLKQGAAAGLAFLARGLDGVCALGLVVLAARYLTPADYGVYSLAMIFVLFLQTIAYTGLFHFVVTKADPEKEIFDTTFWLGVGLSAAGALLVGLFAPLAGTLFKSEALPTVLQWLAAAQPFSAIVAWWSSILMRRRAMRAYYGAMIGQNVVSFAVGAVLLMHYQSVYALVGYRLARILAGAAAYGLATRVLPGVRLTRSMARTAISYASGLYGSRLIAFFSNNIAEIIVGASASVAAVGLYRFGSRIANVAADIVGQPLRSFALAQFAGETREGRSIDRSLAEYSGATVFLLGLLAAAQFVFLDDVAGRLFRPEYAAAIPIAYAFALRAVLQVGDLLIEPYLASRDRTGLSFKYRSAVLIAQLGAAAAASPFGIEALAWTQTAAAFLATIAAYSLMARSVGADIRLVRVAVGKSILIAAGFGTCLAAAAVVVDASVLGFAARVGIELALALAGSAAAAYCAMRWGAFSMRIFGE